MILSDEKRFIFIHIPKCAGSTIRFWLKDRVAFDPRFQSYITVNGLGSRHGAHLPLGILHDHFPDAFEKLRRYRSVAVIRDPVARFHSAFAQHQREFFGRKVESMGATALESELASLCGRLSDGDVERDPMLMHFQRQSDFTLFRGERIIGDLYPMESLNRLILEISEVFEVPPPATPSRNVRRSHRFPVLATMLNRTKRGAQMLLPRTCWKPAHDLALKFLTEQGSHRDLKHLREVQGFIETYYAEDAKLYREALDRGQERG